MALPAQIWHVCMHYLRTELCQTFDPGLEDVVYLHSEKGGKTECRADDKQLLTVASKIKMRQSMSYMMWWCLWALIYSVFVLFLIQGPANPIQYKYWFENPKLIYSGCIHPFWTQGEIWLSVLQSYRTGLKSAQSTGCTVSVSKWRTMGNLWPAWPRHFVSLVQFTGPFFQTLQWHWSNHLRVSLHQPYQKKKSSFRTASVQQIPSSLPTGSLLHRDAVVTTRITSWLSCSSLLIGGTWGSYLSLDRVSLVQFTGPFFPDVASVNSIYLTSVTFCAASSLHSKCLLYSLCYFKGPMEIESGLHAYNSVCWSYLDIYNCCCCFIK